MQDFPHGIRNRVFPGAFPLGDARPAFHSLHFRGGSPPDIFRAGTFARPAFHNRCFLLATCGSIKTGCSSKGTARFAWIGFRADLMPLVANPNGSATGRLNGRIYAIFVVGRMGYRRADDHVASAGYDTDIVHSAGGIERTIYRTAMGGRTCSHEVAAEASDQSDVGRRYASGEAA